MPPFRIAQKNIICPVEGCQAPATTTDVVIWDGPEYPEDDVLESAQQSCGSYQSPGFSLNLFDRIIQGEPGRRLRKHDLILVQELTMRKVGRYTMRQQWENLRVFQMVNGEAEEVYLADPR